MYKQKGYTIIEMIMVIVIIGILAAVTMKSLGTVSEISRVEETKWKMERLAHAITGNPDLISGGVRTDYGYIGDIGSLPSNWDILLTNDSGYAAWDGPYINDNFSDGTTTRRYGDDAWGSAISRTNTNLISTGGGTTLTFKTANSISDLLYNNVSASIVDIDYSSPGSIFKDSVEFILTYPNGTGGTVSESINPDNNGFVVFDSIPIGIHTLQVVYLPGNDTMTCIININPGSDFYTDIQYYTDIW